MIHLNLVPLNDEHVPLIKLNYNITLFKRTRYFFGLLKQPVDSTKFKSNFFFGTSDHGMRITQITQQLNTSLIDRPNLIWPGLDQ